MTGLQIVATGRCLPAKIVSNDDLSKLVDTSDDWIVSRTGIHQRYFCQDETNLTLAAGAARQAIQRAGITPSEIGACVVATFTPDYGSPTVACLLQRELDLPCDIPMFDINGACSGFLYGLKVAHGLLADSQRPYALVIGSEVISRNMDFTDRSTCVLFGDGAGAAVVRLTDDHPYYTTLGSRGDEKPLHTTKAGDAKPGIYMDGQAVFRFAVDIIPRCIDCLLQQAHLTLPEVDYVLCHQANARIIHHVRKKLQAPEAQFYINLQRYGNTSAASIPMALDEMNCQGMLQPGKRVLCVGFGGGFTWGGALLQW